MHAGAASGHDAAAVAAGLERLSDLRSQARVMEQAATLAATKSAEAGLSSVAAALHDVH